MFVFYFLFVFAFGEIYGTIIDPWISVRSRKCKNLEEACGQINFTAAVSSQNKTFNLF